MSNENNVKEADEQARTGKLKGPGHFVWIPKTTVSIAGYREAEVYSVEQLMSYVDLLIKKIGGFPELVVQKKYDGLSIQLHYDGKKFVAFTEQGFDVTARFPKLIEQASSQFLDTPYIIISEVEQWENGSHSGRGEIIGYLNSTSKPDDSKLCASVFDCIWFNGDIHDKTYEDRLTLLEEKFKISQSLISELKHGFNLTPTFIVKNKAALQKAVQKVTQPKESEGAVIKIWKGFHFSLNKRTNEMIKFKKFAEAHFIVLEKARIKGVTFQYHIGIEVRLSERDTIVEDKTEVYNGKTYIRCGKTFNTNIQASVGDVITVRFGNLNVYHRNEKMYFGVYEPSVYENRTTSSKEEEPDNITSLMTIGEESGLLVEKGIGVYVSKATDPFLQYPSEDKSSSYVMQEHFRGKTAHVDFRIKVGNILIGYTLMNQIEGEIKDPVLTIDQGRKLLDNSKNWKFNPKSGEFQERKGKDSKIRTTSIQAALKAAEPLEWLEVEGVTEEGNVGATKKFPGVFVIAAKGDVDYGYREPYFHEYFVYNNRL